MVIEDLFPFFAGEGLHFDHNARLLQEGKRTHLEVVAGCCVDVVPGCDDKARAAAQRRCDRRRRAVPCVRSGVLVLRGAEAIVKPKELVRLTRIPPIVN